MLLGLVAKYLVAAIGMEVGTVPSMENAVLGCSKRCGALKPGSLVDEDLPIIVKLFLLDLVANHIRLVQLRSLPTQLEQLARLRIRNLLSIQSCLVIV